MTALILVILSVSCLQAYARDVGRVSWKECNIDPGFRHDCGYRGITEEKCYQRGCCFSETHTEGTPWCYYSTLMVTDKCMMDTSERIECGSYGIRKDQCLASNCCWQPTNEYNVPWCFHVRKVPLQEGQCGTPAIPPSVSIGRIVGGVEAKKNSWPWQVSLQLDGFHFCGASIVNKHWVVSAAHCGDAFNWGSVDVVVGLHSKANRDSYTQVIPAAEVFQHEEYDYDMGTNELSNDIMLIKLTEPIEFTDAVSPICLPEQGEEFEAGMRCYATGWGTLELHGSTPDKLQQVPVPLLEQETCIEWYADPQNWYDSAGNAPPVTEKMICAGFEEGGRGTCHGDSGGPLVCYVDEAWKLVGVVSWGGPCAHERTPSVFARVSEYREWMKEIVNEHQQK